MMGSACLTLIPYLKDMLACHVNLNRASANFGIVPATQVFLRADAAGPIGKRAYEIYQAEQ
jgi:hypothetical protein